MIQLELATQEAEHLREEMKTRLTELDHEIAHTDSMEFKDMLKHRRESIRKFIERLPESLAKAA